MNFTPMAESGVPYVLSACDMSELQNQFMLTFLLVFITLAVVSFCEDLFEVFVPTTESYMCELGCVNSTQCLGGEITQPMIKLFD